ncbi:MAG: hypothetical protein NTU61_03845, partial [Candidatus Altiarchaeota archaeon]|nr:hypothetical protein [Candidatus Altiarchaeota archaeon]
MRSVRVFCVMLLLCALVASASAYGNSVIVLANSIDGSMASGLYGFLNGGGFDVVKVNSSSFSAFQNSSLIIILGGQNAPEGVGKFSSEILSASGENYLVSSNTTSGVFTGVDVWSQNQMVFVYAGYDENRTVFAWENNKQSFADTVSHLKQGLHVEVTGVSGCTSAKFNEITFTLNASNTSQATWGKNEPDDYVKLYCDGRMVDNFVIFERKTGEQRYGRNDLMHKTIEGEYRLRMACNRDVRDWIADAKECGVIAVNITLPSDSGSGSADPKALDAVETAEQVVDSVSIAYPKEGDVIPIWGNSIGFGVNITNAGAETLENLKLN